MQIIEPEATFREVPVYESYATNEVIGYELEFIGWTDKITQQIDRVLEAVGYGPLPPILGQEKTQAEKTGAYFMAKRREHQAKMELILGRPTTQEAAEAAIKALEYYET